MNTQICSQMRNRTMQNDNASIKKHLQTLKLYHMLQALDEQLARAAKENLPVYFNYYGWGRPASHHF